MMYIEQLRELRGSIHTIQRLWPNRWRKVARQEIEEQLKICGWSVDAAIGSHRKRGLVREVTFTAGLFRPYILEGAISSCRAFKSAMSHDEQRRIVVEDQCGYEIFNGAYDKNSNAIVSLRLIDSSNGGTAVNWPLGGTRLIRPLFEEYMPWTSWQR